MTPSSTPLLSSLRRMQLFLQEGPPLTQLRVLVMLALGWLLSPLCWWNDLVINLPLAYGLAWLVQQLRPDWFVQALVVGYWLSNVVGLWLMQSSALEVFQGPIDPETRRRQLLLGVGSSTLLTVLAVLLVRLGVLHAPIPGLEAIGSAVA